ncbi:MAG: glycosyltransferase family 2 protein [Methanobrevibacter sp.]|jgi:glycosyltransferase involved in cell wall biosynthesis|uniref:glycosyltransferase family 2 protein n=1 Tax=Methanobrevibacter sp. TaxID=66852 RepID=UPI00242596E0|nr:glycosyltransferase family 2 protein [Methanobrevibacter sp.]MBE6141090.1 glycosyltransferase family 2 protein [Bacillota bacterium]MBE6497304.1 glycosyltransferase family 2 protein [Methanobrevibacter sp.]
MSNIQVSIIIPVYNPGKLLITCLDSVKKQTLTNIEILCIDDGSTDNSYQILNNYSQKDKRFKIFSQKNLGAGSARNKGIEKAKGEYIIFLDSDDWIESDMCEKLYNLAKKLDVDLVLFDTIRHLADNNSKTLIHFQKDEFKENYENYIFNYTFIKDKIMNGFYGVIWSKFYRAKFIKDNHIQFPNHKMYNDVEFHVKTLLLAHKIAYFPKIFYHYVRIGQSSLQTSYSGSPHAIVFYEVILDIKKFLDETKFMNEFRIDFLRFAFIEFKIKLEEIDKNYKEEYFQKIKSFFEKMCITPNDFKQIKLMYFIFYIHMINSENYNEFIQRRKNFKTGLLL